MVLEVNEVMEVLRVLLENPVILELQAIRVYPVILDLLVPCLI